MAPKPPKGAQKRKIAVLRLKVHFSGRKSATKLFLCENCQGQNCRAFAGLYNRAQVIGGVRDGSLNVYFLLKDTHRCSA